MGVKARIKRYLRAAWEPYDTGDYADEAYQRAEPAPIRTRLAAVWVSAIAGTAFGTIQLAVSPRHSVSPLSALLTIGGWTIGVFAVLQVARFLNRLG